MTKPHGVARAIGLEEVDDRLIAALRKAWCFEACWDGCKDGYPARRSENPSFGNCLVSTLALWHLRGHEDEIVPGIVDGAVWHFRLRTKTEKIIDATWQQFGKDSVFESLKPGHPRYREVTKASLWDDESLAPRLNILLQRMSRIGGYNVDADAGEIVDAVRGAYRIAEFASARPASILQPK